MKKTIIGLTLLVLSSAAHADADFDKYAKNTNCSIGIVKDTMLVGGMVSLKKEVNKSDDGNSVSFTGSMTASNEAQNVASVGIMQIGLKEGLFYATLKAGSSKIVLNSNGYLSAGRETTLSGHLEDGSDIILRCSVEKY